MTAPKNRTFRVLLPSGPVDWDLGPNPWPTGASGFRWTFTPEGATPRIDDPAQDRADLARFAAEGSPEIAALARIGLDLPDFTLARDVLDAIRAAQRREAAQAPRPGRRHPRRAEALDLAARVRKRNPVLSAAAVGTRVAAQMDGDDVPSPAVVARWIREA